jgi:hypothetical protein
MNNKDNKSLFDAYVNNILMEQNYYSSSGQYSGSNPDESSEKRRNYGEMLANPDKRPQFGSQKANELEQKYEQGMAQIKEKYKDVQRPEYDEQIENGYRYQQDNWEKFFYGVIDDLRAGDKHAWNKMASGDTSRGLYNDVAEVGHSDISFEKNAKDTMRRMLQLADAYYSGDVRSLNYLLGLN